MVYVGRTIVSTNISLWGWFLKSGTLCLIHVDLEMIYKRGPLKLQYSAMNLYNCFQYISLHILPLWRVPGPCSLLFQNRHFVVWSRHRIACFSCWIAQISAGFIKIVQSYCLMKVARSWMGPEILPTYDDIVKLWLIWSNSLGDWLCNSTNK